MKKTLGIFVAVLGLSLVLHGGTAMAMGKRHAKAYPEVQTITKEELSKKMQSGEPLQVVNVLSADHYNLGMIKGSKKIPLEELDKRLNELDKSQEVVTYCASYQCGASREAAHKLGVLGYKVRAYEGGIKEWKESGLPTE